MGTHLGPAAPRTVFVAAHLGDTVRTGLCPLSEGNSCWPLPQLGSWLLGLKAQRVSILQRPHMGGRSAECLMWLLTKEVLLPAPGACCDG